MCDQTRLGKKNDQQVTSGQVIWSKNHFIQRGNKKNLNSIWELRKWNYRDSWRFEEMNKPLTAPTVTRVDVQTLLYDSCFILASSMTLNHRVQDWGCRRPGGRRPNHLRFCCSAYEDTRVWFTGCGVYLRFQAVEMTRNMTQVGANVMAQHLLAESRKCFSFIFPCEDVTPEWFCQHNSKLLFQLCRQG